MTLRLSVDVVGIHDLLDQLMKQEKFSDICLVFANLADNRYAKLVELMETHDYIDDDLDGLSREQWALVATRLRKLEQEVTHLHDSEIPF